MEDFREHYAIAPGYYKMPWEKYTLIEDKNGFMNATKTCEMFGKNFKDWLEYTDEDGKHTKDWLEEFKQAYGDSINVKNPVIMYDVESDNEEIKGTYVQSTIIQYMSIWLSVEFCVMFGRMFGKAIRGAIADAKIKEANDKIAKLEQEIRRLKYENNRI